MELKLLVEIIGGAVAFFVALFALVRYMIYSNTKREKAILDHNESQQKQMLEFYETKNGHIERIANKFSDSSNKMTEVIGKLTTEIKILSDRHR